MPVDTGFVIAGAGANVNTGGGSWANPDRITANDSSRSIVSEQGTSDTLKASNFGFNIPTGAVIRGIETRAQLRLEDGGLEVSDFVYVNVGKSDSTLGTAKNPGNSLTSSDVDYDDGGSSDLWGLTWTAEEINASTFQVRIRVDGGGSLGPDTVGCDAIWCRVYYDAFLSAGAGSFTLTGKIANLRSGDAIVAETGVFSLAGQIATLIYDHGFFIAAEVGSFLITQGTEVVLAWVHRIALAAKTTYDVRPLLTKLRRRSPTLEE